MISPKDLEELLVVLRRHGVEVFKDDSLTLQLGQFIPVVEQPQAQLPDINPYVSLRDLDQAYGIPEINKEIE
jgi:hypothetical protein